jgi:hypothetical protein
VLLANSSFFKLLPLARSPSSNNCDAVRERTCHARKANTTEETHGEKHKQEMLESYQELVKHLEEKRAAELNPVKKIEEKKTEEAVKVAAALPPDGIDREIGNLKADIGRLLSDISSKLETEVGRFSSIQTAVASKERELQELYGIEKAAASLAALIEAKNQKQHEFEAELARQKDELIREIDATRHTWETERKLHEAELKERDATEKRAREREKEESAIFSSANNRLSATN